MFFKSNRFLALFGIIAASAIDSVSGQYRIVNGREARQGQIPYIVSLQTPQQGHRCGGSITQVLGVQIVLTAAHCVRGVYLNSITIVAGEIDFQRNSGFEQYRKVRKAIWHPRHQGNSRDYDIAVVFLDKPFNLNSNVQTIPLPPQGRSLAGYFIISGWGKLSDSIWQSPTKLQTVQVPYVNQGTCRSKYQGYFRISDGQFCAGVGRHDACNGDSGGPAKSLYGGYLAGVISDGISCGDSDFPGIYVRVPYFVNWIYQTVNHNWG